MRENDVIRKGASELLILTLLLEKDMYSQEMCKAVKERSDGLFTIPDATIYLFLYRLSEKGMVSERRELVGKRRQRVYYHLEPAGREYLAKKQKQTVEALSGLRQFYENSSVLAEEIKEQAE